MFYITQIKLKNSKNTFLEREEFGRIQKSLEQIRTKKNKKEHSPSTPKIEYELFLLTNNRKHLFSERKTLKLSEQSLAKERKILHINFDRVLHSNYKL